MSENISSKYGTEFFPNDWKQKKIGEIATFFQGLQVPREDQIQDPKDGYIRFIRIVDLTQPEVEGLRYIKKHTGNYYADIDDVIVVRYGASAGFIGTGLSGIYANNLFKINPKDSSLDKKFLFYYLNSSYVQKRLKQIRASSAMPAISHKSIKSIRILIPPLPEQHKITTILSTVDDAIRTLQQLIAAKQTFKQGLTRRLFSRGIGHTEFKDSKIGKIPKEWEIIKLKETAKKLRNSFVDGPFGSDLKAENFLPEGEIRLIQLQNIGDGLFVNELIKHISEDKFKELIRHETYPRDIVISKMAKPVGRACLVPAIAKKFMIVADCMRLMVNNDKYNEKFVMYGINSYRVRRQAERLSSGTTRLRVSLTSMKNLHFPKTTLDEQNKIVDILNSFEEEEKLLKKQLRAFRNLKKGLMQQLLTGKVRVKVN